MSVGCKCYKFLLVLRFVFTCLPQTGYLHPDEHFQFPEIVYGDFLGFQNFETWEFTCSKPIRCITFPYFVIGISVGLLNIATCIVKFGSAYYPYILLILPRLLMCCFSFVHDWCIFRTSKLLKIDHIQLLNVFASSYITLVYYTRTLSNSVEAVLVTLTIYVILNDLLMTSSNVSKFDRTFSSKLGNGYLVGIFITTGCFVRPTFLLFVAAPVMFWLWSKYKLSVDLSAFIRQFMLLLPSALITFSCFVIIDTVYYNDNLSLFLNNPLHLFEIFDSIVITPLNFICYNFDFQKVKSHGDHPRYLHILVNLHLLFPVLGVWGLVLFFKSFKYYFSNEKSKYSLVNHFMCTAFMLPIFLLSIIPHQEPRFLIPLFFPLIFACSERVIHLYEQKLFFTLWLILNISGTTFWGFLHQGGLTSALFSLHSEIIRHPVQQELNIVFYHTYMPPRYILAIPKSQNNIHVHDLQGSTFDVLLYTLQNILNNADQHSRIFIVTPSTLHSSVVQINEALHPVINFTLHSIFFPHLTIEDPVNFKDTWKAIMSPNSTFHDIIDIFSLHLYKT